jgi:dinuclear metal center YbgI/SA1388 family protein
MVTTRALQTFLQSYLDVKSIPDDSINRFQVRGREDVKKIALGVDACMALFTEADMWGADMALVHHGILWKGKNHTPALKEARMAFLKKKGMSLYASHLPLDIHPEVGNNIVMAKKLGLKDMKLFGFYHGTPTGYEGGLFTSRDRLAAFISRWLRARCLVHPFGPRMTKRVAIISGGGSFGIEECAKKGIDTFITGEPSHSWYHAGREYGINIIYAGHYKTETLGVKALGRVLSERFNIEARFFDIPTGL